jgi:hypothetical protein
MEQKEILKEKYDSFREWQVKPHEVAPLVNDKHECATCHTEYQGNYCPRCGQKAIVGRYSFKQAFLLFLDVWGLGNRGMFRTIRDLLLRPGYMIRDYLSGMQMAYFPPFKMFFLVIALSVFVDSGFNIKGLNNIKVGKETVADVTKGLDDGWQGKEPGVSMVDSIAAKADSIAENTDSLRSGRTITINGKKIPVKEEIGKMKFVVQIAKTIGDWITANETIVKFLWLLVLSWPLYRFFRHNPKIPDMRFSEFFVSMVYITNMKTIIDIIGGFFMPGNSTISMMAIVLCIVPLKQLTGYSYKRTLWKVIGGMSLLVIMALILAIIVALLAVLAYNIMDWE